jgi:hypothetical protein
MTIAKRECWTNVQKIPQVYLQTVVADPAQSVLISELGFACLGAPVGHARSKLWSTCALRCLADAPRLRLLSVIACQTHLAFLTDTQTLGARLQGLC